MAQKTNIVLVDKILAIDAPISSVFAFLSNHENYIRWFPGVVSVESGDALPHGTVGKTYNETLRLPTGRNRLISIEVKESVPSALFAMEAVFPPLHPRTEIRLTEHWPRKTTLSWRFLSRSQSGLGRLLIGTLLKKAVARQSEAGLLRLKEILEQEARQFG
jgi:uncharacterized membrane protein